MSKCFETPDFFFKKKGASIPKKKPLRTAIRNTNTQLKIAREAYAKLKLKLIPTNLFGTKDYVAVVVALYYEGKQELLQGLY